MFSKIKTIMRQAKELVKTKKQIEELKGELVIQKSIKKQFSRNINELLEKLNISNKKLFDIKYILQTEQNEYTVYRKIKEIIYCDQTNR